VRVEAWALTRLLLQFDCAPGQFLGFCNGQVEVPEFLYLALHYLTPLLYLLCLGGVLLLLAFLEELVVHALQFRTHFGSKVFGLDQPRLQVRKVHRILHGGVQSEQILGGREKEAFTVPHELAGFDVFFGFVK